VPAGAGSYSYLSVPSPFGALLIVWQEVEARHLVFRVFLPQPGASAHDLALEAFPGAHPRSSASIRTLAERMDRFLQGEAISFGLSYLALESCSPFQRRVLRAEHAIPRGQVSTYGRIARHLGNPQGARAVGQALARNPFPILIPCHRAIRSDGRLGGFQGGVEMKRALLALEGIEVSGAGRVVTETLYY